MAKIYNFHIYSSETGQQEEIDEYEKSKIKIASELGDEYLKKIEQEFRKYDDVAVANKVDPPGERGGGCAEIFPLIDWFHVSLTVFITLTAKGFFDEIGKGLAKKFLSILFEKERPTKLIIEIQGKKIEIIIPSKTTSKNIKDLERFLDNLENKKGGKCVYSSELKKVIYIDEYEDFNNGKG